MGEALLSGILASGWAPADAVAVIEPVPERRAELAARFPDVHVGTEPVEAAGAVVAVKPGDVEAACRAVPAQRLLSIAAGVRLSDLEAWAAPGTAVVRAMPNTPALVGAGAAALAAGSAAGEDDVAWAEGLLGSVGVTVRVPEKLLDAVTGLSGSGPAYVFLVAEALIEAGVLVGLPRETSRTLTVQTLLGAARLLDESGDTPEVARAAVTSPGGTTAAGLAALEQRAVRSAFLEAVQAASRRAAELGASHPAPTSSH